MREKDSEYTLGGIYRSDMEFLVRNSEHLVITTLGPDNITWRYVVYRIWFSVI